MIRKIYFDMDGVLADFERGVNELCGIKLPKQGKSSKEEDDMMWEAVRAVPHFYERLRPMAGAMEMLMDLAGKYECAILSAPPKESRGIASAKEDKISWIHKYLGEDIEINIVPKEQKKKKALGKEYILIDDLKGNIDEWEARGGTGMLFTGAEDVLKRIRELEKHPIIHHNMFGPSVQCISDYNEDDSRIYCRKENDIVIPDCVDCPLWYGDEMGYGRTCLWDDYGEENEMVIGFKDREKEFARVAREIFED